MQTITQQMASETAVKLILAFPHLEKARPESLAILTKQLVTLLIGQNEQIAEDILHPQTGMPGKSPRLTAYEMNQWIGSWNRRASVQTHQVALEPPAEPVTDEERQRVSQLTRIAKAALQDATAAMRHNPGKPRQDRPPPPNLEDRVPKAERDAMLLKALGNMPSTLTES